MNFCQLAEEFSRLNPIDVHLLIRNVADPIIDNDVIVSRLLSENKLVERFGEVAACSNVKKPEGWEQAILLVDKRLILQQKAYDNWRDVANETAALFQSMWVRNFNSGHDQIIEFVRAIDIELPSQNKTEFVDLFTETKGFSFDSTKGRVTSIEDIPKKSARYCRSLIACESHVKAQDGDELPKIALKALIDGGDPGLISQAIKIPAKQRHNMTMLTMLDQDRKYYEWSLSEWTNHLRASKPTIKSTDAWRKIMGQREQNKQDRAGE